jgi:selenocysteine-specific elongation factor
MKVIGTAGHVDHGKSTLVRAMTGIDPDRLKEEKVREMTIDLGFAWLELPNGETAGIIDVPGHRDFIENMLAGVGAIDAAMLVVDVNEGFMPQTREHLAILDQLHIRGGVIVLTKCDLITDPGWIDLVTAEIRQEVQGRFLANAPIIPVSSKSGSGIPLLKKTLGEILEAAPLARDIQRPRLSVDRVFSIQGYGTVVTGTLLDGRLIPGDELLIQGNENHGRIRGLQSHNKKIDVALPGSRAAINLSGLDVKEVKRGDMLCLEQESGSLRIDTRVELIPSATKPLKHNDTVKFFHLAFECSARVRLLGKDEILPGENGFIQLELSAPLFARVKDRFILRNPSPSETIGGGGILKINVLRKYRRFSQEDISRLATLHSGNLEEAILGLGREAGLFSLKDLEQIDGFSQTEILAAMSNLVGQGQVIDLASSIMDPSKQKFSASDKYQIFNRKVKDFLSGFHKKFPIKIGATSEEVCRNLKLSRPQNELIVEKMGLDGDIKISKGRFSLPDFQVRLKPEQKAAIERVNGQISQSPFSPPDVKTIQNEIGPDLLNYLVSMNVLVQVTPEVVFRRSEYDEMLDFVKKTISDKGTLTVTEFRDAFGSSRKYSLAFLEHLDASGITVREGDFRTLKKLSKEQA